jgi:hypothetical protein
MHQQPGYVCVLTQKRSHTPLILLKNKKTRQTKRVGKYSIHLASDRKPLKDLVKLIETQKENKNPINNPKNLPKKPRETPQWSHQFCYQENPPITIPRFKV